MNELNPLSVAKLPTPLPLDVKLHQRWWWVLLCGVVGAVVTLAIVNASKKYVGLVVLRVYNGNNLKVAGQTASGYEIACKIILGRRTLLLAGHGLGLAKRWGLESDDALSSRLFSMIELEEAPSANNISIRVFSENHTEAAEIANAIADANEVSQKHYLTERNQKFAEYMMKEVDEQKKKVEGNRLEMLGIMRKYQIIDASDFGANGSQTPESMGRTDSPPQAGHSEYQQAKGEYASQLALLNEMLEHFLKEKVDLAMPIVLQQIQQRALPDQPWEMPHLVLRSTAGGALGLTLGLALALLCPGSRKFSVPPKFTN